MVKMDAGVAVIEMLKQEGVSHIFGIVGSSFLDILDPLFDRSDVKFIGTRHEQGAALMADGYSRTKNQYELGAFTMQSGPGAENALGGVAQAFADSIPILLLPGGAMRSRTQVHPHFESVAGYQSIT